MITPWAPDFEEDETHQGAPDTPTQTQPGVNCETHLGEEPHKLMQARPKYGAGQKRTRKGGSSGEVATQKRRSGETQLREREATSNTDSVQQLGEEHFWITRSVNLPEEKRNGWVVAWIIESHFSEQPVSQATGKPLFGQRMEEAGLGALLGTGGPRAQCRAIA